MTPTRFLLDRVRTRDTASEDGFTLVEVLVSFVLFAMVAAAATTAIARGVSSANTSRDRTTAADLAASDIAQVRSLSDRTQIAAIPGRQTRLVGSKTYYVARTVTDLDASGATVTTTNAQGQTVPATAPCTGKHDIAGYTPVSLLVTTTVTWPGSSVGVSLATRIAC